MYIHTCICIYIYICSMDALVVTLGRQRKQRKRIFWECISLIEMLTVSNCQSQPHSQCWIRVLIRPFSDIVEIHLYLDTEGESKIFNDINVFINAYLIINQFFLENLWKRDFGNLPKSLELPSFKTFRISWWQVRDLGANGNVMKKRYCVLKTMMEVRFQKKWSAISKL